MSSGKIFIFIAMLLISGLIFSVIIGVQITEVAKIGRQMNEIEISTVIGIDLQGDKLGLDISFELYNPAGTECTAREFDLILFFGEHILGIVRVDSFNISEINETININSTITPETSVMTDFSASYDAFNTPIKISGTICFVAEAVFDGVSSSHSIDEEILV